MSKKGWFKPLTQLYNFTSLATLFKYSPMRKDWTFEIKLKWPYLCISCNFPWYTYFNFYQLCRKLRYFTKLKDINDKKFYVLKIHLNLFEISNQVLKLENLIQIWKFDSYLKIFHSVWKFISNMDPAVCRVCELNLIIW